MFGEFILPVAERRAICCELAFVWALLHGGHGQALADRGEVVLVAHTFPAVTIWKEERKKKHVIRAQIHWRISPKVLLKKLRKTSFKKSMKNKQYQKMHSRRQKIIYARKKAEGGNVWIFNRCMHIFVMERVHRIKTPWNPKLWNECSKYGLARVWPSFSLNKSITGLLSRLSLTA